MPARRRSDVSLVGDTVAQVPLHNNGSLMGFCQHSHSSPFVASRTGLTSALAVLISVV
jgi:hypothetical protein